MQISVPRRRYVTSFLVCVALLVLAAVPTFAQVNGAIYTTTSDGTTVNGNIYAQKTDVYLNGGPQNKNDPGLVPDDGLYYFMVTDPSGAQLLSADSILCRQVTVSGGRITAASGSCPHPAGTPDPANGETPVQLCPAGTRTGDNLGNGTFYDPKNWCDTTSNSGGEYKAWMTPVANYSPDPNNLNCSSKKANVVWGFCDSDSKTDNFKIRNSSVAYVTVCKFNDENANGVQDEGELLIPFWPINASGVDTEQGPIGTVNGETDATGCVSFSVSDFSIANPATVTLTENVLPGWDETAPLDSPGQGPISVSGFVETITVKPGDNITAPNFGNTCVNFDPINGCGGNDVRLNVTKDANPSFTRTYTWGITKSVDTSNSSDPPTVYSAGGGTSGPAKYTVSVTHDNGTDSGWQVTGTIKVSNPSLVPVTGVTVTDNVDNGGTCQVAYPGGANSVNVPASSEVDIPYVCTYSSLPDNGTNTAQANWDTTGQSAPGTASIDFSKATIHVVDGSVSVTDTMGGSLGTVSSSDPSPTTFTYSKTFTDPAGTCTSHDNTATFTTNTSGTTGDASQSVKDCQGADLTVSKTAAAAFVSGITKGADKTQVEQAGGNITFNYTVTVTESLWTVAGNITVSNPNDWESIDAVVTDQLIDTTGACVVNGGSNTVTVAANSSSVLPYTCTFALRPAATTGTNTALASWDSTSAHTPDNSATGRAGYAFSVLTINDNVQSSAYPTGCNATLGTMSVTTTNPSGTPGCGVTGLASSSWGVFTYSITDANASPGQCSTFKNTADTGAGQSADKSVTVCNTNTGALTMGFWQNSNGQGIVKNYCGGTSGTNLMSFLANFNPYKDDTVTTCTNEATYVYNIIKAATCTSSTSTCNSMLRAQMLATALDVYFSTPSLGGNRIGAYNGLGNKQPALGGIAIDLSTIHPCADSGGTTTCSTSFEDVRPEFGINPGTVPPLCLGTTISNMLSYANYTGSTVNGNPVAGPNTGLTSWYKQAKSRQVYAKDGFDNTNNQIAKIAPTSCNPSF